MLRLVSVRASASDGGAEWLLCSCGCVLGQLHVFTDGGRVCRPLFVVETLDSGLQQLVIRKSHIDEVDDMEDRLNQYEDEGIDESVSEEDLKVLTLALDER